MNLLEKTTSKLGNPIELLGNPATNNVLVIGVFHGDEPQGKFLIDKYIENNPNSKLLFIPCLNPDGMQLKQRTNSNNVDLNRNLPTSNWGKNEGENATCDDCTSNYFGGKSPASEIETQFVINAIEKYNPKVILTLHTPYKVVNYDGPAKEIAERISDIINYPAEGSIGYPTPGSFGTYCGVEREIPTITLEMDETCPIEDLISPITKIFNYLENIIKITH